MSLLDWRLPKVISEDTRSSIWCHSFVGTKQLKLDPTIYESLQKERVAVGDVIYIESNSGAVKVCVQPNICSPSPELLTSV